jgi:L-seryl-tRNA(Ser) seleniumtransferase
MDTEFRHLPSVDKVLSESRLKQAGVQYPHGLLVNLVRQQLEKEREKIVAGKQSAPMEAIAAAVEAQLQALQKPSLQRVVNASGVILHTNLGRAPLSRETLEAMEMASRGYCNLEFDIPTGNRGSRQVHIENLLCRITGAEAALVVNNNAAAVLLGLMALAKRKEAIVSRGQAVEIGGGFRIPDVMRQSGAKLVEVGTTNCTYAADYEAAITERTAALMRVHSSNFRVVGYTSDVTIDEMVAIGREHNLLVLDDQGSGCFLNTTVYGLAPEPIVQHSVAAGASLVFFSGDKLVGGPQAGIIIGKKEYVDKLKKHPLARAVRIDKIRLAGLTATLLHYIKGEATEKIPIWRMISAPREAIERRAALWAQTIGELAQLVAGESMVGGGSLPDTGLPTSLVAIRGIGKNRKNLAQLFNRLLRQREMPVIGRVNADTLLLDPRTVLPEEDDIVIDALREIAAAGK